MKDLIQKELIDLQSELENLKSASQLFKEAGEASAELVIGN